MQTPTIFLKAKKDESVRRFHTWVFSGAIRTIEGNVSNGSLVRVCANKGAVLGYGHYSPDATIAIRMIHFGGDEIPEDFWQQKLQQAYHLRTSIGFDVDGGERTYRLVHAEGDGLSGLIIDHYEGHLVIQ